MTTDPEIMDEAAERELLEAELLKVIAACHDLIDEALRLQELHVEAIDDLEQKPILNSARQAMTTPDIEDLDEAMM
jgi:hypothetical protein